MPETATTRELRAAQKVTLVGLLINALGGLLKILVGLWAHSVALVADGIHSLSDLFSDLLVLLATHYGRKAPDQNHPYGHDRYETLATLILGGLLIALAGALIWDGISRLLSSQSVPVPNLLALLVALASILSKEWIFRYTLRVARQFNLKLLEANAWNHRTDALSSIIVFIALIGAWLGFTWLDQVAAILVALLVAKVGIDLIWMSLKELVDTALPEADLQLIRQTVAEVQGVTGLHQLRSRSMGNRILLDLHLQVTPKISVSEGHAIGVAVSRRLQAVLPHLSDITIHVDPENDEQAEKPALPLREEVIAALQQCWQDQPEYIKPQQLMLHYLQQGLDVELFYTCAQLQPEQLSALQAQLRQHTHHLPWLRQITLWTGQPETIQKNQEE